MTRVLAIDPGNTESAYVLTDHDHRPVKFAKAPNEEIRSELRNLIPYADVVAIEMIASYGMSVGADIFETCVWIGRFAEQTRIYTGGTEAERVKRHPIKVHHCHDSRAKDSNITQALVDRFAAGVRNRGKGTKADPGWFYGFAKDVWQAYALAVYIADTHAASPDQHAAGF